MDAVEQLARDILPFAKLLGIRFLTATPECLTAEMKVREDLCTRPAVLHGGAMMALADTLGGWATSLNLHDGATTTTLESKTNFLAPAMAGTTVRAECVAIHRGRRTMVWQTRVTSENGKLLAIVTQTQAVLHSESQSQPADPARALAALFPGKSPEDQMRILARLERAGAQIYQSLIAAAHDQEARNELRRAAEREDANARALERIVGAAADDDAAREK